MFWTFPNVARYKPILRERLPQSATVWLSQYIAHPFNTLFAAGGTTTLAKVGEHFLEGCRSASPAPAKTQMLSIERQILVRKSWNKVSRSTFGTSWMTALTDRVGKNVFGGDYTSIQRHTRHFMDLIQSCVENLNDLESALKPWLDTLGQGHRGFKIKARHWEAFGESLASTITEWIGPGRSHKETVKGWMILSSFLADRLAAASRAAHSPMLTPRVQLMTFNQH